MTYPIKKDDGRWYKPCSNCGIEQSYLRKNYAVASMLTHKPCKACTAKTSKPLGMYEDIHISWFNACPKGARERGLECTITIEDVWNQYVKQGKVCNLTGKEIGWCPRIRRNGTASIDRIDSSKGYTIDNIQLVHKDVNFMKGVFSQEYFIQTCKDIATKHS